MAPLGRHARCSSASSCPTFSSGVECCFAKWAGSFIAVAIAYKVDGLSKKPVDYFNPLGACDEEAMNASCTS